MDREQENKERNSRKRKTAICQATEIVHEHKVMEAKIARTSYEESKETKSTSIKSLGSKYKKEESNNNRHKENETICAYEVKEGSFQEEEMTRHSVSPVCHPTVNINLPASLSTLSESQLKLGVSSKQVMFSSEHVHSNLHLTKYGLRSSVEKSSLCRKCTEPFIFNQELLANLIDVKSIFRINKKTGLREFSKTFFCGICDCTFLHRSSVEQHIQNHYVANDIWYCLECQKEITIFGIAAYPKPEYIEQLSCNSTFKGILMVKEKCDLRGVSIRVSPMIPLCGKCRCIIGYIGPVLHKLFDANSAIYRLENGDYRKIYHYICCLCSKVSQTKSSMEHHVLSHVQKGNVLCKVCKDENKYIESEEGHGQLQPFDTVLTGIPVASGDKLSLNPLFLSSDHYSIFQQVALPDIKMFVE